MNKTLVSSALIAATLMTGLMTSTDTLAASRGGSTQSGKASYYHDRFHGRKTASGVAYNKHALSAAHKTLPLGTQVRVTDARSGKSVVVQINDRGPYARGRVIDLSRAAAREIGLVNKGVANVKLEILGRSGKGGI
ncbi:MAG: septal ring lytic transglycosylase RlpA family protein [Lamprocystis purpurea]|jgi:rare lipoprotein A|uniref:septal ring lytic transglycosylase RlpA family protein n=1 Tax=Lamprocystis purpurea TaxID=61598 RepID=UPI0003760F14|nr:septal ring lytic transglycosylase RlpA family protein [Lamprocystis purpurea]MBV5272170.1 septal ring lytic transglycosylase RlpA family protein [Lamprocystis purpurea]